MADQRLEQDKSNHRLPVFFDEGIKLVRVFVTWQSKVKVQNIDCYRVVE